MILIALLLPVALSAHLSCYHCISQVPLELVQQDAKDAFKTFMFSKFNVPPSHLQCHDAQAFEFPSVKTEICAPADQCIKTHVKEMSFDFVMRGCLSSLYKPGYQISTDVNCTGSAATCLCSTDLCNTAIQRYPFLLSILYILLR